MKKISILLLASVVAFSAISWTSKMLHSFDNNVFNGDPVLMQTKSFNMGEIKNVEASTSGGSISVAGDATDNATVEIYANSNNGKNLSKDEIQQILDRDYTISITSENGTLKAIAKRNGAGWKNWVSISFKIHTAKNVGTNLNTSGGSISLASLQGDEKFSTSGGGIHFENLSGNIDGHTSGGSISASNSTGNIKVETSGGSLDLKNLNGNVQMNTSGGSISANDVKGSLDISTGGGSINLTNIAAKINASTSGGSISANLDDVEKDVALSTDGGSIHITIPQSSKINFDLKGTHVNVGAVNHIQENAGKDYAKGTINGGGATLTAKTSAGSTNLSFK